MATILKLAPLKSFEILALYKFDYYYYYYYCEGVGFDGLSLISSASLFGLPSVDSTPFTSLSWASETPWPERGELPMRLVSPDGAKVYKDPVKKSSEDSTKRTSAVQQKSSVEYFDVGEDRTLTLAKRTSALAKAELRL